MNGFATLRSLVRKPEAREHCDLCGASLMAQHPHLIDPVTRRLVCACDACTLLFYRSGETKYKRISRGTRRLDGFLLSEAQWDSLMIPIGLAFFVKSSADGRVLAMYPSPAGAMESMLNLEAWTGIVEENPVLEAMETDVEALLVNRLDRQSEYYLSPIDKCYELVGLIRANWRGLSGGNEMWGRIREFLDELRDGSHA